MRKRWVLFFLLASLKCFPQLAEDDHRILNEYMVMLKPGYTITEVQKEFPALSVKACLSKRMNIWLMERGTKADAETFLSALRKNKAVKTAQFNHRVQERSVLLPNDTLFNQQWDMENTGQNSGIAGDDIDATEAWAVNHNNVTVNGDTIVVAVIDVGFDQNHQDLNFFRNYQEIPNNGIDDDGNGYIDDYEGWNVYNTNGDVAEFTSTHSMHLSGIIGAIGNNHIGIAGICWGVKVLRICGSSSLESGVIAAYDYVLTMRTIYNESAGTRGAYIVSTNTSFGIDRGNPEDYPLWCAMYDAMGAVGVLSAGATANSPVDVDQSFDMPTACPSNWLIAVTNTTNLDRLNTGSAYGKNSIDLGAPGTGILSTVTGNNYGYLTGTSMAAPHVAGTVAAMYAAACSKLVDDSYAYPDSVALVVKQMILAGATPVTDLYGRCVTGGRLNLYHAIKKLEEYNCNGCNFSIAVAIQNPTCSNSCDGSIQLNATGGGVFNYGQQNLCAGYYPVTLSDTFGCKQTRNIELSKPDSIIISSVAIEPPNGISSGIVTVSASASHYTLEYSLDAVNYQNTPTLVLDSNGHYTIYVRNENGCVVQYPILVNDVAKIIGVKAWNIFPNPANDILNISIELTKSSEMQISIINLWGENIFEQTKEINAGFYSAPLSLSSIPNGLYFLRLRSGAAASSMKFAVVK